MLKVGVDLQAMQRFDEEIAALPSYYTPELGGRLFVVLSGECCWFVNCSVNSTSLSGQGYCQGSLV